MTKIYKLYLLDGILVFLLIVLAALPRLIVLEDLPAGLHGDEGWTGLDTREILKNGYIGPYTDHALGQPIGPLYWAAIVFKVLGESVFSLRASMGIFGILTPSLLYILCRLAMSRFAAFFAGLALSFSLLHIHYSRIGFMVITSPVPQILSLITLLLYTKTKRHAYLALCAVFTGIGIYTYNAFVLFPLTVGWYLRARKRDGEKKSIVIFSLIVSVLLIPLFWYIARNPYLYAGHFLIVSPLVDSYSSNLEDGFSLFLIAQNAGANIRDFILPGPVDDTDSFGKYFALAPLTLALSSAGIMHSIKRPTRWRTFMKNSLIVIALGLLLTTGATYRRNILILAYIYFFLGSGIVWVQTCVPGSFTRLTTVILALLILLEGFMNLSLYFGAYARDGDDRYVFAYELSVMAETLKKYVPEDTPVYLFSHRWPCDYETVRFIYPDLVCEDRSHFYGTYSHDIPRFPAAFALLDEYRRDAESIRSRYPEHTIYYIKEDREILGIIIVIEKDYAPE